jgi:hypothetical protein
LPNLPQSSNQKRSEDQCHQKSSPPRGSEQQLGRGPSHAPNVSVLPSVRVRVARRSHGRGQVAHFIAAQ